MRERETILPALEIHLFGPFDARVQGKPLPRLRSKKGQWILALLALRHDREVARDWLAGTLWPDSDESQGLSSLRRTLTDLRAALGDQDFRIASPTPQTLRFDREEGVRVDVLAFDAAMARKDVASLEEAVALYSGPLLEGCNEDWVFQERIVREQAFLTALETLANRAQEQQNDAEAIRYLRRIIAADPLRESAQRALMQAFASSGDYAAAAETYRAYRFYLHSEMNAEPDAETVALAQRLREEARQRLARIAAATTTNDERRTTNEPPCMPEQAGEPPRLPRFLSDLVGREDDIAEVKNRLAIAPLVTLVGMGGVGKTRLAVRVAEESAADFPDGARFADLSPLTEGALVAQAAATAFGLRETPGEPLLASLCASLSERTALLVLDNCEHLLDACAELTEALLRACPNLRILATSREVLRLPAETVWRVPSLTLPDEKELAARDGSLAEYVQRFPGVRLFVSRAQRVAPNFTLSDQNAATVAKVCMRLDGLPLAIELAAARIRALPLEEIYARLDDRFRLLTGGNRAAQPRQQTLQAAMDWSHDLLNAEEKTLLRRLSVFSGGWTLEAAEAICADRGKREEGRGEREEERGKGEQEESIAQNQGESDSSELLFPLPSSLFPSDVLDLLLALVDKSLVAYEEWEGVSRYRLLETVRLYARDRLRETGEEPAFRRHHREHFLMMAEEARPRLFGSEQQAALAALEREHDNLRAALDFASEEKEVEEGLRLGCALGRFWYVRGYLSEGRRRLDGLLQLASAFRSEAVSRREREAQACALDQAGGLARNQGALDAAQNYYTQSLRLWRELADRKGIAGALNSLGNIAFEHGEFVAARNYYAEGLAIRQELGERHAIAHSYHCLACVAQSVGDLDAALGLHQQSLLIFRELEDKRGVATALFGLGAVQFDLGEAETAELLLGESLSIRRDLDDPARIAESLTLLGGVAEAQGELREAWARHGESLSLFHELGDRWGMATAQYGLATLARKQGDFEGARQFLTESLTIQREMGNLPGVADALQAFASLALAEGEPLLSARLHAAAETLRERIGAMLPPRLQSETAQEIAALRERLGEGAFEDARQEGRALDEHTGTEYALNPAVLPGDEERLKLIL